MGISERSTSDFAEYATLVTQNRPVHYNPMLVTNSSNPVVFIKKARSDRAFIALLMSQLIVLRHMRSEP